MSVTSRVAQAARRRGTIKERPRRGRFMGE
jgi:hypothetical protein